MWLKFLLLIFSFAGFLASHKEDHEYEEFDLHCSFEQLSERWVQNIHKCSLHWLHFSYGCNIKKLTVSSRDMQIQEVLGTHRPSRSNQDVVTVYAYNTATKYIPKRLGFFFTNLRTMLITKSSLRLIEFRDFRHMKKLQKLILTENGIERIPPCVFKYAENLEVIDLSGNQITELREDTFVNLPNLETFFANDNIIGHLEIGLFRNNLNLKKISMSNNNITIIEINFMKIKDISNKGVLLVDLRENPCTNLVFGCCDGPAMREFQNQTSASCRGPEVC